MSVKVYSVYMATFSGHKNDTATLADPNGRYVDKNDYDKLEARCKELEEMRDTWKRHFEVKDDLCKYLVTELHNAEQVTEKLESENRILKAKLEKCKEQRNEKVSILADLHNLECTKFFRELDIELDSITIDSIKRGENV